MDEQAHQYWQILDRRVALGEPLNPAEQAVYQFGCQELDAEERLDGDLERELRFHVSERIEELRDVGMNAEAAARLARRQFGNYTAQLERTRDMDIAEGLDAALRNLRLSLRLSGRDTLAANHVRPA